MRSRLAGARGWQVSAKRNFLNRMGKGMILHAAVAAISVE